MGRRRLSEPPDDTPQLCRRFDWLLRNEFGNSITLMASALGASHAALSRVLNHGQLPGAQMIEALARTGRVDLGWLFGTDEQPPTPRAALASGFVPVSDVLLDGPPGARPEALGPLGLPTASPYAVGEGYWFRVPADSPLVAREAEKVAAGDYLLIAAGAAWTARPDGYAGRLVVLRHPKKQEGLLARVVDTDFFAEPATYDLDTFDGITGAQLTTGARPSSAEPVPKSARARGANRLFYPDDVVGVVLEKRALYSRRRV